MNFIDKALESNLRGDDFLQAMSDIYLEPEIRNELDKYPVFIKDIIRIIDYDTTLQMDGLPEIITSASKSEINDLISALKRCGATTEAKTLKKAVSMSAKKFEKSCEDLYDALAINNDYDGFWELVVSYINKSLH